MKIRKPDTGRGFTSYYLFVSISYFNLRNYRKALKYIRKVIDGFNDKVRLDFVFMIHVLHVLTHFELEQYEILPYLITSLSRFTQSRELDNKGNRALIRFLSELAKAAPDKVKTKKIISNYRIVLEPFRKDDAQNLAFDTQEIFKWMDNKLNLN